MQNKLLNSLHRILTSYLKIIAAMAVAANIVTAQTIDWSAANITIKTEAQLRELVHWVDYGHDFSGKIIKLGADITLTNEWKPIGSEKNQFKGVFDGGKKSISNVLVLGGEHAGFFGYIGEGGQVKNLVVNVAEIKTESGCAGGLAGIYASTKAIENCGVNIKDSIVSSDYSGGLVGRTKIERVNSLYTSAYLYGAIIIANSYVTGNVSASSEYSYSGGLVGVSGTITINNSYSTGNISASSYSGGLVGRTGSVKIEYMYTIQGEITIINSYAKGNVTAFSEKGSYSGGLVGDAGTITISNSYSTGKIYASSYSGGLVGDGRSITIYNSYAMGDVSVHNSYDSYDYLSNSKSYGGGLVGNGTITIYNSYATGNVSTYSRGYSYSGGLVGNGTIAINNSYATGDIFATASSSASFSGGLVGNGSGTINSCYANGAITGNTAGGLAGNGRGTINNCYAFVNVTGESFCGGLVGENSGIINNCYAFGNVKGKVVGGLAGLNEKGTITNCYILSDAADMLVGQNSGGTISMTSGFRDMVQMKQQSNYKSWNFADIWAISPSRNNGFPYLRAMTAQFAKIEKEQAEQAKREAAEQKRIQDSIKVAAEQQRIQDSIAAEQAKFEAEQQRIQDSIRVEEQRIQDSVLAEQQRIQDSIRMEQQRIQDSIETDKRIAELKREQEELKRMQEWAQRIKNANGSDLIFRTTDNKLVKFESKKPFPVSLGVHVFKDKKVTFKQEGKEILCYISDKNAAPNKVYAWSFNGGKIGSKYNSLDYNSSAMTTEDLGFLGFGIFDVEADKFPPLK
jgi:hypothetical protein